MGPTELITLQDHQDDKSNQGIESTIRRRHTHQRANQVSNTYLIHYSNKEIKIITSSETRVFSQ